MPDLTPTTAYACESNENWTREVKGSKGKIYTVRYGRNHKFPFELDFSCDCPSYKYKKGYCKHIESVKSEFCGWHSLYDHEMLEEEKDKCPRCGLGIISYTEYV